MNSSSPALRPRRRLAASLCRQHQVPVRGCYRIEGRDACVLCLLERMGQQNAEQTVERRVRR